ncbi:MAG: AmmeMemoRadiSam system protein B [Phycisphaerales bacterium]
MSFQQTPPPPFNPAAPHQQKPRLRAVRGFPARAQTPDGKVVDMLGLSDATQVSDKVCVVVPAVQIILPLMDGSRDLDQIVQQVGKGLNRPFVEQLVAQLDDAGLLEGPTFDGLLAKMRADFDASPVLPPASTAAFIDALVADGQQKGQLTAEMPDADKEAFGVKRLREVMDEFISESLKTAQDPSLNELPKAIIAPHLDYGRGWNNYGSIYGRLRVVDRPDRVIILGTNHFGRSTGVCGCDKGYQTPLGTCEVDSAVVEGLKSRLGDKLFEHRFDHEREHSIELQIPWIQHVFGQGADGKYPKVFGAHPRSGREERRELRRQRRGARPVRQGDEGDDRVSSRQNAGDFIRRPLPRRPRVRRPGRTRGRNRAGDRGPQQRLQAR